MPESPAPYDAFAPWYGAWCASAPITEANRAFYVEEYLRAEGLVVELGVGDGRIALEAARRGRALVGVDESPEMLALCRRRAEEAGVGERLELVRADFRDFPLDEPAALIALPFHSIGHLLTAEDRRACLAHVHERLAPGGRFVFDHFVADPALIERLDGVCVLRSDSRDPETGRRTLLWATTRYDVPARRMRVVPVVEEVGVDGRVGARHVLALELAWIVPEEVRALLEATGFEVEALHGDFQRGPFGPGAHHQVWSARRPG